MHIIDKAVPAEIDKTNDSGPPAFGWRKHLAVVALMLLPVWLPPVRTAAPLTHVVVWLAIVCVATIYCATNWQAMSEFRRKTATLICGVIVGNMGYGALVWGKLENLGDEGHLIGIYFIAGLGMWHMLTHRAPNGDVAVRWW